jgi:citrate lyase beta subunit
VTPAVTFLFVPAHDERKVRAALLTDSDAVILDLEDSVPDGSKAAARDSVRELTTRGSLPTPIWVRVNAGGALFHDDVEGVDWSKVAGAVLPKAESPSSVVALEDAGARRILLLIESAAGIASLPSLAHASTCVAQVAIGTWDLALDLGLFAVDDPDESELMWQVRGQLVLQSRVLGLIPPLDGVFTRLDDEQGLRRACDRAFRLGFGGKLVIHPKQLAIARSVFQPDAKTLQLARETIAAYERATVAGRGAIRVDGRMVDRPMVERARALTARWAGVAR